MIRLTLIALGLTIASGMGQASGLGAASPYDILDYGGSFALSGGSTTFSDSNFLIGLDAPATIGSISTDGNEAGAMLQCNTSLMCTTYSPIATEQSATYNIDLDNAVSAVNALYSSLITMTPTQTYGGAINGGTTFTSSAGSNQVNVIALNGGVNQTGGGAITISGNSTDTFIFLVNGQFKSNQSGTVLTGGIAASNIIWVDTSSSGITIQNGSQWDGTILAPSASITANGSGGETYYGSLISGAGISITGNPTLNDNDAFAGTPGIAPEPPTALLILGAGLMLAGWARARGAANRSRHIACEGAGPSTFGVSDETVGSCQV